MRASVILITCLASATFAGCSQNNIPNTQDPAASSNGANLGDHKSASATLYVLNTGGTDATVTAYRGSSLVRTLSLGKIPSEGTEHFFITTSGQGLLYTESPTKQSANPPGMLAIYKDNGSTKVASVNVPYNYHLLAADSLGDIFTMCGVLPVCEYSSTGKLVRKFSIAKFKLKPVVALAVDKSGNLAIVGGQAAAVFAPRAENPFWTIGTLGGLVTADSAVFDPSGNLYIADLNAGVRVFAPGGSSPARVITDGVYRPTQLASDSVGNVYVLNRAGVDVSVYPPGQSSPSLVIQSGLTDPVALAVDATPIVYVANDGQESDPGNVIIYSGSTGKIENTITSGILEPEALSVEP